MTPSANTAAMEALIEAHAIELKLPTVRRRFRTLADEATRAQQTPTAYLAALLEAEVASAPNAVLRVPDAHQPAHLGGDRAALARS